jgi:glycosyltransferase involved in cell wall biosynthesis
MEITGMKKLLYITNGIKGAAGLERVLSIKASYLADHLNYDVHILTLNNNDEKPFYDFSAKITMHDIAVAGNPIQYIKSYRNGIKAVVGKVKPDIISVCDDGLKGFFLPLILGKPCPMIYERHVSKVVELGADPGLKKKALVNAKFRLMTLLGKQFDKFVVLTHDNIPEWKLDNLEVISNPLSFYPAQSSTLQNKKVIAVGKQSFQKGFDRLLEAWEIIYKKHPDWELTIYGKFNDAEQLPELARKLNISDVVRFSEPVKDIETKFLDSSIFAFSSRFEGFGMVLIEAMACGVPCVSFDCPCGPSDIVKNNVDGFLVEEGDICALAEKLLELIENQNLRQQMGRKAKVNVKRYLPETIVPQWDALFKSLLK